MNNEYITKSQAIDLAESLRPIAGNGITDAFIKGIEGAEGITDDDFLDVWFANRTLEVKEYYERIREASNPYQVPEFNQGVGQNTKGGITMAQEWISVKDRLPEPQQEVLVSVLNDVLFRDIARVGWLDSRGVWRVDTPHEYFHRNITHWMPMPEPPKE